MSEDVRCDLLVIGSGGAGLTAAISARAQGLEVLVVEKEPVIGGTTAISGGWLWIPGNPVAARAGVTDSVEAATTYIQHEAGNHFDPERTAAFLEHGPRMVDFLEQKTAVRFAAAPDFPDYHPDAPGGGHGRSIVAEPYDARELGDKLSLLRRPLRETTFLGLNVGSGAEVTHFFNATRSITSALFVGRRLVNHAFDVISHGRGMRLANGNALAGRLLKSVVDLGIQMWPSAPVQALIVEGGKVRGAVVQQNGARRAVTAARGVVLACGGFPHDIARRKQLYAHAPTGREHHSTTTASNTGDGLRLGESAGGVVETGLPNAAPWVPVSLVRHGDGSVGVFPHVIDRAKPGVIAVTRHGRRFVNEASSYHDFVQAMIAACVSEAETCAFVVCDHRAIRRYGLGYAKPFPVPLGRFLKSGYLLRGETLADLARNAGIDAAQLEKTVAEFNAGAKLNDDRAFGKGSTAYNRFQGDRAHRPNPCLAPLEEPPYYAVKIGPGDLGTFAGLRTDRFARVLDGEDRPVPGLYAAGNDMSSILGGNYSGAGINIGPAMVFGYIAGRHAAGITN